MINITKLLTEQTQKLLRFKWLNTTIFFSKVCREAHCEGAASQLHRIYFADTVCCQVFAMWLQSTYEVLRRIAKWQLTQSQEQFA